jgi:acetolactate synthase-1/3 small subunit
MTDKKDSQAMPQENEYTITVFTENVPGLLSEVVSVFTRIKQNIDSLTVSASSTPGIHRFTVTTTCTEKWADKIVAQLEKKIDVVAAFSYLKDEVISREIGMFKINAVFLQDENNRKELEELHNPAIIEENEDYAVLIKTGREATVTAMFDYLKSKHAINEFVRSGSVAVVKAMNPFTKRMQAMNNNFH